MFTPPDADNPDLCRVSTVDNSKWRVDKFPEKRLIKLRYNATLIQVIHEKLYLMKHLRDQPVTNLAHTLCGVPCQHLVQVAQPPVLDG
jgi:hypothetical protein